MSVPADRINRRTASKAAIKRASSRARAAMNRLDRQALADLEGIYRRAVAGLQADIRGYAGTDGSLRLEVLQDLLRQANQRLADLAQARNNLLDENLAQAAQLGVGPYVADAAIISGSLNQIADDAVRFVRSFVQADGLQLSDRIWRIDRHAREVVSQAIESAVIQGHSASRAAQDFLARGAPVPKDLVDKIGQANAERVARQVGRDLMTGSGSPYDNARRLFRTEINRAHGEAYQAAAFAHPDVIGTRFLLSPRHPEPDICDMHARVNRYGLGPGVYPQGKNPWPAHPNTLSYVEAVFADEISAADRQGKESRIDWLQRQPPAVQESVLGSRKKRAALHRGILRENEIGTPWRVLKKRYERRGIDVDALTPTPRPDLPAGSGLDSGRTPDQVRTDALRHVLERGEATGFEHLVAYDTRTGAQFISKTTRSRNSVSLTRHDLAILMNPRNRIELVHNHPSGSSLSVADLRIATLGGTERVTAYGHDGSLYSARALVPEPGISSAAARLDGAIRREVAPLVAAGRLSSSQAGILHSHLRNLALDRERAIEYSVERIDGALKNVLDALDSDTVQQILDAVTQAGGRNG
ncbi:MAG TPA: hypothetical protein ENK05_11835 [Gammaproteobacteria bacterium]|nr:hypothetical protein [Gammaproteobacteria bacterium]